MTRTRQPNDPRHRYHGRPRAQALLNQLHAPVTVFQKIGSRGHTIITAQKLNIRSQNIFLYQGASRGYVPPSCARRRTASPGFVAMAEIITLQFGSYANYIGTHYWNFQVHLCLHGMQQRTARDPCVVLLVLRARMSSSAQRSQRRRLRPKSTRRCCTGKALTARCACVCVASALLAVH